MGTKKEKFELILSAKGVGFTSSISKAVSGLNAFNKEVDLSMKAAKRLDRGLAGMAGKFTALFGGVSTIAFGKAIWDAGVKVQALDNGFKAITGSSELANKELEYLRKTSDDLGLNFETTADAYKGLAAASKGTSLEGAKTRDIFLGISEASTVLGLSADQSKGALVAIAQMMSKGNVSAEELRGQLGERLPGAFQLAAKAMGVTTQELDGMLKKGQVSATDMLPKLAEELHKLYAAGAATASNGAIQNLNRFQNAWFDLKTGIAESGFLDVATGRLKDLTAALADPAVKERIVQLSAAFFKLADSVIQFSIDNGATMAKLAIGAVALSGMVRTVALLTGIWNGLNAVMLVITGSRLIPYLGLLKNSLGAVQIASLGVSSALGAAAGATLALIAGFKAGEFLYEWTEPAERALVDLQSELDTTRKKYKQFSSFQPESQESLFAKSEADLNKYKEELISAYKHQSAVVQGLYVQSRETTLFGNMTAGAKQAKEELITARQRLKQIETGMDEYATVADRAYNKISTSAAKSGEAQKAETIKVTDEMKSAWEKYRDKVLSIQDQIANKERSLAEKLRNMSRSGMSDIGAWKDRKKEAQEYESAAKRAAKAGNFDQALAMAQKAENAYSDLNKEVKDGDTVLMSTGDALKTSMAGVKSAGELSLQILKQQEDAAAKTADALNFESGFQLGDAFTEAGKSAQALAEQSGQVGKKWRTMFLNMEKDASSQIAAIDSNLNKLARDRDVYLRIHEVQAKAQGGMIQKFAAGGRLSGYGGGDRIHALLEAGEFIIRKEAVAKWGSGIFHALNNFRIPDLPKFAIGGPVLAGAGAAGASSETVTVKFDFGQQGGAQPSGQFSRNDADNLMRILKRQARLSSA